MKSSSLILAAALALLLGACTKSPPVADAPVLHGVIQEVRAPQGVLIVKHEDIPGMMPAMTMAFHADAAALKSAAKDQSITARVVRRDGMLWLEDMKAVPAKK